MRCCNRIALAVFLVSGIIPISSIDADDEIRLTTDGRQKSCPVFRNEGQELVYAEFSDSMLFRLRCLTMADGTDKPLHPDSTFAEFEPTWSADGERYAHLKLRGTLSVSIVVRDKRGAILHEILPDNGFRGYRSPAISPDHSRLIFSYAEKGSQQIFASQLSGDGRVALTDSAGLANWPTWSPDGKSIVFSSTRDGNFEIYRMKADGSEVTRLTDNPLQDIRPKISPDGTRIVFTSHRDGNAEIYVMNIDGSNQRRITNHEERDDYADWHPDGNRIVFVGERQGKHDLYLLGLGR